MATDARGHTVPAAGDHPSRAALLALSLAIRDPIPVANTTARGTLITTLTSAGVGPSTTNPVYVHRADARADAALEVTTDGTTWRAVPLTNGLTAYTPALTAQTTNPTLGTGSSASGTYDQAAGWVKGELDIVFGTSGVNAGAGVYEVSLPVAASSGDATTAKVIGYGVFIDVSPLTTYVVVLRLQTTTTARFLYSGGSTGLSNSAPVTPAVSDRLHCAFGYQVP